MCHVSLVIRALAPEPQGAGLLTQHALHHQRGLIQLSAPGGQCGTEVRRAPGRTPCPVGSAHEVSSVCYLAVKNTCIVMEVGGALVGRAASSPLLGETLKTSASLAAFCCPAPRGQEDIHGHRQFHVLFHKTSFVPGQPASKVSPLILPATQGRATQGSLGIRDWPSP